MNPDETKKLRLAKPLEAGVSNAIDASKITLIDPGSLSSPVQHQMIVQPLIQISDNLILNRNEIKKVWQMLYSNGVKTCIKTSENEYTVSDPGSTLWLALASGQPETGSRLNPSPPKKNI